MKSYKTLATVKGFVYYPPCGCVFDQLVSTNVPVLEVGEDIGIVEKEHWIIKDGELCDKHKHLTPYQAWEAGMEETKDSRPIKYERVAPTAAIAFKLSSELTNLEK